MQNRVSLLIIFIAAILCGCQKSQVDQQLDHAESIMEEHPDSALTILQQIDGTTLHGEPQARHALLLSQAYDKNYIDLTSDSLISIATSYYDKIGSDKCRLMAKYYHVVILMNRQDYDQAISESFEVAKLADKINDLEFLAKSKHLIARAYLYTYNQEGAKDYFQQTLQLVNTLSKPQWKGFIYLNLADLSLLGKNYAQAVCYVDSAKVYIPADPDIAEYEMLAHIGMGNYIAADSIFNNHIYNASITSRIYNLLTEYQLQKGAYSIDSLSRMLPYASLSDSIDIAYVGSHISQLEGDYYSAWYYTDMLLRHVSRQAYEISTHSLYSIQLEQNKAEIREKNNKLQSRNRLTVCVIIIVILFALICVIYIRQLRRKHKDSISKAQNEIILISSEIEELHIALTKEITKSNDAQKAAQELFLTKYSWIEELGNLFIDAEASKSATNRVMRDLKSRLDKVKTHKFLKEIVDIINKYRNNILARISIEVPSITESERTILSLLCAHLSPRIISFILDIKPQSLYNAKHSIKIKLEASKSHILDELRDIYT